MSVTSAQGFIAAGASGGLKSSGEKDVALVVNTGPESHACAVFTTNRFAAAPVLWSRAVLADHDARVVVLNSGGANACTGPDGFTDTHRTAEFVAKVLTQGGIVECAGGDVVVCSTGIIGDRIDMAALERGVHLCSESLSSDGGLHAAQAIMTTDTVPKVATCEGSGYSVGGMAKGAGMLAPGMATMLCVITTDASIPIDWMQESLEYCTSRSFDRLDSDGCMSTNDTVVLLANGASGYEPIREDFEKVLFAVCDELSIALRADAEGSTKDISIQVLGAHTEKQAVEVGRAVARSNLFKCAMFGEDPNWGRILSAVGTTNAQFEPDRVNVSINGIQICTNGSAGESRDGFDLSGRHVEVIIDLREGEAQATIRTNDLSLAYVHENSAYST